jgi:hypothetical protein
MSGVTRLPQLKRASITVTRRNAEDIVWSLVKPEGFTRHFDSITWTAGSLTFHFRDPELEGEQQVTVFKKGDGSVEVVK